MTDEELRMAAEWLARDGANCQLHINIADEIKRRLALRRPTAVGELPVNVDGIDRLDVAVTRLAETVKKRDAAIVDLSAKLMQETIKGGSIGKLRGVEVIRNSQSLLMSYVVRGGADLFRASHVDYWTARIVPREIDRD